MSFIKFSNALVSRPSVELRSWVGENHVKKADIKANAFIDLAEYPLDRFLFTQATIMGSVGLESNGYYITSGYEPLVNMNGDCWENQLTLLTYPTFKGAYNFLNHVQIPEQSKGTVLDACAKHVVLPNGLKSVYVDILVATDRKHVSLCKEIESGMLNTLSLGSVVKFSRCSKCGKISYSGSDYCSHLLHERRDPFTDENGIQRIISEVCGDASQPDSNYFIEASWVGDPAFYGAVKRHILTPKLDQYPTGKAQIRQVRSRSGLHDIDTTASRMDYLEINSENNSTTIQDDMFWIRTAKRTYGL